MNMLTHHFEQCHPEFCAAVDAEHALPGSALRRDQTLVFLLTVGVCHFVLRIEVAGGSLHMAVQLLGTHFNAEKWVYELHVYNKAEPRRKYHYNGLCSAITAPCAPGAELAGAYAASFLNRDELFYKVYLKKRDADGDQEPLLNAAREPSMERTREPSVGGARRPRSRQRPYKNKPFEKSY
ncbi:hypothetical protein EVAR_67492_1 [Eumeta japonica]|uniref:Uncharacterized protein n=1 Tax=Eumeta variegata TaxID=151549 RepID=A0A4C1ZGB3_EUMVA|nr:hypothetical protein EVAR_67492_1 [Eumeta japonica]